MSYHAGIGSALARNFGTTPCEAHIACDGCGETHPVVNPNSNNLMPPRWFFVGKAPRGWRGIRVHDGSKRWDLCPKCWKAPEESEA